MRAVAVLMSTYNGEAFLRTQIDSILAQTGVSLTLLARDDGSNDGTRAILDEYQDRGLLRWYTGPNLRSAYSFWDLLERAPQADYYAFADQDDYWYPDKLAAAVERIESERGGKPALYFCKKRLVDGALRPLDAEDEYVRGTALGYALLGCRASGCTMVFDRALMERLLAYKPAFMTMHDSWVLRVAAAVGTVLYDDTPHMDYRQHGGNVVGSASRQEIFRRRWNNLLHHRKDTSRTDMARQLYDHYAGDMAPAERDRLRDFADMRRSFPARLRLIGSDFLKTHEAREIVFVKCFVLLGWL